MSEICQMGVLRHDHAPDVQWLCKEGEDGRSEFPK